jgi:hypothetical protein
MAAKQNPVPPAAIGATQTSEDNFILMVDIVRTGIFLDRALEAGDFSIPFVVVDTLPADPQSLTVLWRNLRQTGREAVIVKELYCAKGLVKGAPCKQSPPAFIQADAPAPNHATQVAHLQALQTYLEPFIDVACALGKAKTKDDMFCSVE